MTSSQHLMSAHSQAVHYRKVSKFCAEKQCAGSTLIHNQPKLAAEILKLIHRQKTAIRLILEGEQVYNLFRRSPSSSPFRDYSWSLRGVRSHNLLSAPLRSLQGQQGHVEAELYPDDVWPAWVGVTCGDALGFRVRETGRRDRCNQRSY